MTRRTGEPARNRAAAAALAFLPILFTAVAPCTSGPAGQPDTALVHGYELGPETIPNADFDNVGPLWQQLRPDEGVKLAVIPEGWRVGYQGGERLMPIPGQDPDTGNRCMVFLYGAGQVDLFAPAFPLDGSGTYLLSMRTRSVVNPSSRALRAILRLLHGEEGAEARSVAVAERAIAAGPGRAVWRRQTALLEVPPGATHAELHLVKSDAAADFLVDDVSLRRITATAHRLRVHAMPSGGAWESPVVLLGPVAGASLEIDTGAGGNSAWTVWSRTGASAVPGAAWTAWRRLQEPIEEKEGRPLDLLARGTRLYAQIRLTRPVPGEREGGERMPPESVPMEIRTLPWTGQALSEEARIVAVEEGAIHAAPPEAALRLPPAGACTDGSLRPVREIAMAATAGIEGDLPRARALGKALHEWMPFIRRQVKPSAKSLGPAELLEDCRRSTPLRCDPERRWDLLSTACRCLGMICRPVKLHTGGDGSAPIEGLDVWSNEENRWIFLPLDRAPAREGELSPDPGADAPEGSNDPEERPSAAALAARSGARLEVAMDLEWGHRGWVDLAPDRLPAEEEDLTRRVALPAEMIDLPLNQVGFRFDASSERSLTLHLDNSMPDFAHYLHRFSPLAPWKPVPETLVWNLVPGENLLEVRAESALGALGPIARARAHVRRDPGDRFAAYGGLRALGGDPHVHTGLGIYGLLEQDSPLATGDPEGVFASAVENGLHWAAVTDYSGNIDDPRALRWRRKSRNQLVNPDGSRTQSEWKHLKAVALEANDPGRFAAFVGVTFDGGGLSPAGGTGRKIILLPDEGPPTYCSPLTHNVGDCPVVEDAYRYARENGGVMIAATPCWAAAGRDTDWSRHDPIVTLLEIYGGVCEHEPGGLVDVTVRRGLLVGAGGGSDDRTGTAGTYDRTICWAEEITRPSIIAAMRERRCYWSAAGHLDLLFTVNDAPMGSVADPGDSTAWAVLAENSTAPLFHKVEVIRDGEAVASAVCESSTRCFIEGGLGEGAPGVYYAAVSDAEGNRLALSSPVFVQPRRRN